MPPMELLVTKPFGITKIKLTVAKFHVVLEPPSPPFDDAEVHIEGQNVLVALPHLHRRMIGPAR